MTQPCARKVRTPTTTVAVIGPHLLLLRLVGERTLLPAMRQRSTVFARPLGWRVRAAVARGMVTIRPRSAKQWGVVTQTGNVRSGVGVLGCVMSFARFCAVSLLALALGCSAPVATDLPPEAASGQSAAEPSPPPDTDLGPGSGPASDPGPEPPPASSEPVTLVFGGDVHGEPPIDGVLARGDNPLADLADTLSAADIAVVNVETAVGTGGTPADKAYVFQAPEELWGALTEAGVDVVTLANNHALDYGPEALQETIAGARAAGLEVVGAGANADEAYGPAVIDVNGSAVAIVGLTRVMPVIEWAAGSEHPGLASAYDEEAAVAAVQRAARVADHVVVTIHWGRELDPCPVEHQAVLASRLTEAGADVVAGHHGHRLQGLEDRNGSLVAYGLGNLVFYASREEARRTALLRVTLGADTLDHQLIPARIDDEGSPRLLPPDAAQHVRNEVASLTPGAGRCAVLY